MEFDRHVAGAGRAHFVIPSDNFAGFSLFGVGFDPRGNFVVVGSGSHECFEAVGGDFGEIEEDVIERAVEMVFAIGSGERGSAFVEGSLGYDIAGEGLSWAGRVGLA